jgi:hypothetical protein
VDNAVNYLEAEGREPNGTRFAENNAINLGFALTKNSKNSEQESKC